MRLLIPLLVFLISAEMPGQTKTRLVPPKANSLQQRSPTSLSVQDPDVQRTFRAVQEAIATGAIAVLRGYFGEQVSLNLQRIESGVYSGNQAASILGTYFEPRQRVSFSFTRMSDSVPNPYATGRLTFLHKGNRESVQVYVSLSRRGSTWVVCEFNVY
jgi:hypothetical protein